MTIIIGKVADTAANPAYGRVEFSQAVRFDDGQYQVTSAPVTAQVIDGELRTLDGDPFSLPANPENTAVEIREMFGGLTFVWWAAVPDTGVVEYRELPLVESADVPQSVWGPPPWLALAEQARDDVVQSIAEGQAAIDALGGLEGLNAKVQQASDAAVEADVQADRAEAAASSIDMSALNAKIDAKVSSVNGKGGPDVTLLPADVGATVAADQGSIPLRSVNGRVPGVGTPTISGDAANKSYVDSADEISRLLATVAVTCEYKTRTYGGQTVWFSVVRAKTGGKFIPGLVRKAFGGDHDTAGTSGVNFKPPRESLDVVEARHAPAAIGSAGGWRISGNLGEMRGAQIKDGVIYHEVEQLPTGSDALGYMADGSTRWFSWRTNGDTAASMKAAGVVDCFSFGPCVVRSGVKLDLTADSAFWTTQWTNEISGRQILGQSRYGDAILITAEGVSGSYGLAGNDMAAIAADEGCWNAIVLDGGGSAQTRMSGDVVTPSSDGSHVRPVPDFVMFMGKASNRPDTGWRDIVPAAGVAGADKPQVRRRGSDVDMKGGYQSGFTTNFTTKVGTLPLGGFAPTAWRYMPLSGTSHSDRLAGPVIKTDGSVELRVGSTLPTYIQLDGQHYLID